MFSSNGKLTAEPQQTWELQQKHLKCREAMFSEWLLHTVSAFCSEPASRFAATLVLEAFCGIYFIDSLFPDFQSTSQVCFTLAQHLICSLSTA